jgi:NitT/TauT family transport system substrate-binding protein
MGYRGWRLWTAGVVILLAWLGIACQSAPRSEAGAAAPRQAGTSAAPPPAPIKVRLSQPIEGLGYTSIYVARHNGYFVDEGLDLEVINLGGGGGPDTQALIAGEVQFNASATTNLIAAYQEGSPLVGVVSLLNRPIMFWVMHKEVAQARGIGPQTPLRDRLAALKGLTIGVTRLGSLTDQLANYYARKAGLAVGEDVVILAAGSGASLMAALEHRRIDVMISATPEVGVALNDGLGVMFSDVASGENPELADYLQQVILVRSDYAREHPDTVRKVARAIARGNRWVSERPVEEIAEVLRHYLGQAPDDFMVQAARSAIPPDGRMTERGVLTNYEMMELTGTLKERPPWNALVTNEYLIQ